MIRFYKNNSKNISFVFKKADGSAWNIPVGDSLKFTVKKSPADDDANIIFQKEATSAGGNSCNFFVTGNDTCIDCGSYIYDVKDTTLNLTLVKPGSFYIDEVALVGSAVVGDANDSEPVEVVIEENIMLNTDYDNLSHKPTVNSVELSGNVTSEDLGLQDKLIAGTNITISNNVISATGGGGGTSDYSDLTNKPKINNVTLTGNKTAEDLGLADGETVGGIDERLTDAEEGITSLETTKADKTELPEKLSDLTNDLNFVSESVIDNKDAVILNSAKSYTDNSVSGLASEDYVDTGDTNTLSEANEYTDEKISEIDIPTKLSDLTNDSGFITSSDIPSIPTKTSDLVNDSGYITSADIPDIPTKTSDLTNDSGFLTSHQDISGKADTSYVNTQLAAKQNTLTAGTGISITGNVISATGSGGTSDYTQLSNKPSINSITLTGNKSLNDLGIQHQLTAGTNITISNNVISASGGGGGGSDIATDTLNNKLESYILRGEVVDINALNTLLENKINGVT